MPGTIGPNVPLDVLSRVARELTEAGLVADLTIEVTDERPSLVVHPSRQSPRLPLRLRVLRERLWNEHMEQTTTARARAIEANAAANAKRRAWSARVSPRDAV